MSEAEWGEIPREWVTVKLPKEEISQIRLSRSQIPAGTRVRAK